MTKAEEKLDDVKSKITQLSNEAQKRVDNFNQLVTNLRTDITSSLEDQDQAEQKISSLNNEIKLLESNTEEEKKAINNLKNRLDQLNPDLNSKDEKMSELQNTITDLKNKLSDLEQKISSNQEKKAQLESEQKEKQSAYEDLEASIENDLESNKEELEKAKQQYNMVLERNQIWDYLFEQIETPKVEIMAIIAANREISTEEIKSRATNVSPVFVGRAISTLQADEKIVSKGDKWDLSSSLLDIIEST